MSKAIAREIVLEKLVGRSNRLLGRIYRLQEEELNEAQRPRLRKLVGRCFVYRNSYGTGDPWPLYLRIVSFDEKNMRFYAVSFQRPAEKRIEIEERAEFLFHAKTRFGLENGYRRITFREWNKAKKELLRHIGSLLA